MRMQPWALAGEDGELRKPPDPSWGLYAGLPAQEGTDDSRPSWPAGVRKELGGSAVVCLRPAEQRGSGCFLETLTVQKLQLKGARAVLSWGESGTLQHRHCPSHHWLCRDVRPGGCGALGRPCSCVPSRAKLLGPCGWPTGQRGGWRCWCGAGIGRSCTMSPAPVPPFPEAAPGVSLCSLGVRPGLQLPDSHLPPGPAVTMRHCCRPQGRAVAVVTQVVLSASRAASSGPLAAVPGAWTLSC